MKLLIDGRVLKHTNITGVERHGIELLRALNRCKVKYDLALPPFHNRYFQHFWEHTALAFRARNYDLLFSPGNIAPLWKPPKTKLVTTIHDLSFLDFPGSFSKTFRSYYSLLIPRIIKISDAVITPSQCQKEKIIERYPSAGEKIYNVPCFLSEKILHCNPILEKEEYILYVGSLNWRKNYQGAIQAFYKIMDRIPHRIVIVGGTSDIFRKDVGIKNILERIPDGRIEFKGYVDEKELLGLYRKASLFIFPSFYEGFGLPPLEAMACGCPVVVSNATSLPEVCGDAAFYVDPYNVESIALGIHKVLAEEGLRKNLIEKGLERAKFFSEENTVQGHLRVFQEVLDA